MADTRRAEDIKRQFDLTMKAFEKNVSETVESYEKSVKPLSEKISKTNKDFEISKTSIEKNLKSIGVNTEKFFKTITKEANKTGKSVAEVMNKYFGDREEYITDELKLLKAREKKANLSWRGQKTLSGRLKGLIGLQLKELKEKSPILSTLSGIKDFVIGNKNAMLENEKEVLSTNQEILEITRKRQKEDEDNQKNIKAAYIAKKTAEEKKRIFQIRYDRWLEENLYSSLSDKAKERKKLEMWQDIDNSNLGKSMAEARYKFESKSPKTDIKKTTGKMPEEQKVQVSNNKLMKKMVTSLSKIEDQGGGGLGGLLKLLAPLLLGGAAFAGLFKLLGSKDAISNALSSLRLLPKLDKIKDMLKGISGVTHLFGGIGKMSGILGKVGSVLGKGMGGVGKVVGKIGGKLGLNTLKKFPGIGLLISVALAIPKFKTGDYIGGFTELLSGGLATFAPGIGTAISVILDSATMFADFKGTSLTEVITHSAKKQIEKKQGQSRTYMSGKLEATNTKMEQKYGESTFGKAAKAFGNFFAPVPSQKQTYTPIPVSQHKLEKINNDDKQQKAMMDSLKIFLKNDFATVLAKKTAEMNKKSAQSFSGPYANGYSAYSFQGVGQ